MVSRRWSGGGQTSVVFIVGDGDDTPACEESPRLSQSQGQTRVSGDGVNVNSVKISSPLLGQ